MIVEFCLLSSLLCLQTHAVADFLISPDVQESNVTARQTANLQQLIQGTINIKSKFAEQEQQLSELEREKDILMTTMFDQSADYNGHHYLASRLYYEHIDMVEYLCELFGGYLVEINDEGELNFLRPFLNSSSVWTFLVGAVRNNKNQWEYKFSGQTVTYFDWQKNLPPDTEDNCMTVSKSSNWQMNDAPCITTGDSDNFICEIPNP